VLHDFVKTILSVDESANVIVLGDMNDFQFSDPLGILTGAATGDQVLTDLVDTLPEPERYSYDFEGNSETLDHILTTQHLTQASVLQPIHVNAEFANQASDHDPMLVHITLAPDSTPPHVKASAAGAAFS
jgi:predicted extracellular nuclease